ncbi:hypothetical protein MASSI9I_40114 [Massilia sp. 9I]|nr:hypothetical protein MASSI9I_40114 [Massilia sp. 9I]
MKRSGFYLALKSYARLKAVGDIG